jgi:RNA polymerase sigma-70 factor (ECF subfamily)
LDSWRRDSSFSTWLFAVALNVYRSEVRGDRPTMSLDDVAEPCASARSAAAEDEAQSRAIRNAVLTLPPKYRDATILYYFREMDVAAAAGALGLSEGTLKARLSRARKLLARKLPHWIGS